MKCKEYRNVNLDRLTEAEFDLFIEHALKCATHEKVLDAYEQSVQPLIAAAFEMYEGCHSSAEEIHYNGAGTKSAAASAGSANGSGSAKSAGGKIGSRKFSFKTPEMDADAYTRRRMPFRAMPESISFRLEMNKRSFQGSIWLISALILMMAISLIPAIGKLLARANSPAITVPIPTAPNINLAEFGLIGSASQKGGLSPTINPGRDDAQNIPAATAEREVVVKVLGSVIRRVGKDFSNNLDGFTKNYNLSRFYNLPSARNPGEASLPSILGSLDKNKTIWGWKPPANDKKVENAVTTFKPPTVEETGSPNQGGKRIPNPDEQASREKVGSDSGGNAGRYSPVQTVNPDSKDGNSLAPFSLTPNASTTNASAEPEKREILEISLSIEEKDKSADLSDVKYVISSDDDQPQSCSTKQNKQKTCIFGFLPNKKYAIGIESSKYTSEKIAFKQFAENKFSADFKLRKKPIEEKK